MAQWVARLTPNRSLWDRTPSKAPVFPLGKKLYPHCLVLVGSRNGFEHEFTIKLK